MTEHQIKRAFKDIFSCILLKPYVGETVLIRSHNICSYVEIWKISLNQLLQLCMACTVCSDPLFRPVSVHSGKYTTRIVKRNRWMDDLHIGTKSGWQWKAVCNGILFTVEKISPRAGLELGTARSVGQRLTHWATGAPIVKWKTKKNWIDQ